MGFSASFSARWMMNGLSQYGLFNLTGSAKIIILKQFRYSVQRRTDAMGTDFSGLVAGFTGDAPTSGQAQDFASSAISGVADSTASRIYRKTAAAWWAIPEELYEFERYDVAGHEGVVTLQNPLVINPGFGFVFFGRSTNSDCQVQAEFLEVNQ